MKICIPIKINRYKDAMRQVKQAAKKADLIELWLDKTNTGDKKDAPRRTSGGSNVLASPRLGLKVKSLIKLCNKPVIAVCKGKPEKGAFRGSEKEKISILKQAVKSGAKFIDIGFQTNSFFIKDLKRFCRKNNAKLIVSSHFWDETPDLDYLLKVVKKSQKLGADIVKVAVTVKNWSDNTVLFELTKKASEKGIKIIVVGMGNKGKLSRVGCPLLGSYLTYAALDSKSKTAPGQLTIDEFNKFK